MDKFYSWAGRNIFWIFMSVVVSALYVYMFAFPADLKTQPPLREFKDGIQNHLIWDIKGQCFFVRPNDDVTVYLIRVTDCDRK